MFQHTIAVVDVTSGRITDRASDTLTLDVPADFDRAAGVASVDARSCAHYLSTAGSTLVNPAPQRPLSWRVRGEECLVARVRGNANETGYRLCAIDPAPDA